MLLAYLIVMGSPVKASVEAQFSFVKLSTCTAMTRWSHSTGVVDPGLYRSAEISRGRGVPIAFRYELYPVVERRSLRRLIGTKLPRRRLPSVSGRESKRRKLLWPLSQT